jgi:CelD/BcsL family acetyltransferase involved in cellulose biosynthesis
VPAEATGVLERSRPIPAPLPRIIRRGDWIRYVPFQFERYYTDLTGSFEAYLGRFSSKTRSTLRRKARRLEEAVGHLELRSFRTPEEMRAFHEAARVVSAQTYQERLIGSGLPSSPQFLEQMLRLAALDRARAYLLYAGDQAISYLYCPVEEEVLLYDHVGYDQRFGDHSPGTVLQMLVFERLFAEGRFLAFDFTEGESEHKRLFATGSILCADVHWLPRSAGGWLLVASHAASIVLSAAVVQTLNRLGLKSRVKRILRRGSVPAPRRQASPGGDPAPPTSPRART